MRIAFTSDIHTDFSAKNAALVPFLVERVLEIDPDVFILAGDIATERRTFAETLAAFSQLECVKLVVPGNHDIWIESRRQLRKGIDSSKKYHQLLPVLCDDNGFIPVWIRPYRAGRFGFIGSVGWYDYSFRNPGFDKEISMDTYARGQYGLATWVDVWRAWWLRRPIDKLHRPVRNQLCKNDFEVCAEMADALRRQLQHLPGDGIDHIIAVIHHLPFKELVRHSHDARRDFFSAFTGSDQLGAVLLNDSRVSHAICGHVHRKRDVTVRTIRAVSSPVGYHDEWQSPDYQTVAADGIGILDIM